MKLTCKDCIHYDICIFHLKGNENEGCLNFKTETQKWIPVSERLPKGRRGYLCLCVYGDDKMKFYNVLMFHPEKDAQNGYVTGPHFSDEGMYDMRVTHWMPLPEAPKEVE